MKALVRPDEERVLRYRLDEGTEKGDRVRRAVSSLGIKMVTVTPAMLSETVGFCAGVPGFPSCGTPFTGDAPEEEMLVLRGLTQKRLDALLAALRESGAGRIDRKAVVTAANRSWTFLQLHAEVSREHAFLQKNRRPAHTVKE